MSCILHLKPACPGLSIYGVEANHGNVNIRLQLEQCCRSCKLFLNSFQLAQIWLRGQLTLFLKPSWIWLQYIVHYSLERCEYCQAQIAQEYNSPPEGGPK